MSPPMAPAPITCRWRMGATPDFPRAFIRSCSLKSRMRLRVVGCAKRLAIDAGCSAGMLRTSPPKSFHRSMIA